MVAASVNQMFRILPVEASLSRDRVQHTDCLSIGVLVHSTHAQCSHSEDVLSDTLKERHLPSVMVEKQSAAIRAPSVAKSPSVWSSQFHQFLTIEINNPVVMPRCDV